MSRWNPWYEYDRHAEARRVDKVSWYAACYGGAKANETINDLVNLFDMGGEL